MKKIAYLSLALALCACSGNKSEMPQAGNDYAVQTLKTEGISLNTSYPATIKGIQDIEIRPKIAGHITKVLVDEGDFVRAGQPLFLIDHVQYEAAVRSAEANVNVVKTTISTQQLTVDNKKYLFDKGIISEYDYNVARNELATYKAQLAQAEAALVQAKNNLHFCTVTSPADGVVGTIPFRVGSLVSSSTQQPLTTVSNIGEMYVYFSMTEKQLLAMTRTTGGINAAVDSMPAVRLLLADGSEYSEEGRITAVSGVIDQNTGAVQMRATFNNAAHLLRSGGTGSVLVPVKMDTAILVPQNATFSIQEKKFVYVVGQDNVVKSREISILPQNNGQNYVVTDGVKVGERIVVDGVNKLKNGQTITPITPEQARKKVEQAKKDLEAGKFPGEK